MERRTLARPKLTTLPAARSPADVISAAPARGRTSGSEGKLDFLGIQRYEVLLEPSLTRDYHSPKSNNLLRFAFRKGTFPTKPATLGLLEGYALTSVPAILLPPPLPVTVKHAFSTELVKNRARINNEACRVLAVITQQKAQVYPDPFCGASASFLQRLSEISYLEEETVQQEKIKKLKKSKRQDS
ncbi:putative uncharacterized protein C8orf89 homolog [Denticeps clupeoides]|uniref:putative uncharacterized protein C8orf89 homolog n=1 Tax=Denticeps clupeoides TaxID=299321 RepID=UPI0010A30EBB|nr:putative uncharacterized protein C8orf89 homolog [Denticeps clupeoides]